MVEVVSVEDRSASGSWFKKVNWKSSSMEMYGASMSRSIFSTSWWIMGQNDQQGWGFLFFDFIVLQCNVMFSLARHHLGFCCIYKLQIQLSLGWDRFLSGYFLIRYSVANYTSSKYLWLAFLLGVVFRFGSKELLNLLFVNWRLLTWALEHTNKLHIRHPLEWWHDKKWEQGCRKWGVRSQDMLI